MPVHPIDFDIQAGLYSTPELAAIFTEEQRFSRWLRFEAALALSQAELGIIPAAAADEIVTKANLVNLDLDALRQEYRQSRNSLLPLVRSLRNACSDNHGEFVHYGATTQDVLDTSQVLEIKETLQIVYRDLRALEEIVLELADRHRLTPMIGRTHGQQALPITFGLKAAIWLAEIRRHIERLKSLAPRLLHGHLHGAVGTRAAAGISNPDVPARTLARLGLSYSELPQHTSRDNLAELAAAFGNITCSCEKIANEIIQLGKTEIGELAEPAPAGSASSSTMPHKRNPVLCQRICVLARHARHLAAIVMENTVHEHERDTRALWSEWLAIPQLCIYTGTACHFLKNVLAGIEVRTDRMAANLELQKELLASEWLLFRLAPSLGKIRAQEMLQELIAAAGESKKSLRQLLAEAPETTGLLTEDDLRQLDHPERYTGAAAATAEAVIDDISGQRQKDPEVL